MKLVPVVPVADLEEYEKAPIPDSISDRIDWAGSSFEPARSIAYCLGKSGLRVLGQIPVVQSHRMVTIPIVKYQESIFHWL